MINRAKLIKLLIFVIPIILFLSVGMVCYVIYVAPQDKGTYRMDDYTYAIECGYKPEQQYGEVHDYRDAYTIAEKVIAGRFQESNVSRFNAYYKRDVFYDPQTNTFLVHIHPADVDVLGGGYGCIISSDGTVVSCWREK